MNKAERSWHSIRFVVMPEAVEAVEFALNSMDALGIEVDQMQKSSAGVCVTSYFEQAPDKVIFEDELEYALQVHNLTRATILAVESAEIQNADWLAEWKKHWTPTSIGRFLIAAPWHDIDEPGKIVIRIEPNMAFGTGTHPTTQLCLEAIGKHFIPNDSFLDIGTGTGILAIAAAKLSRETAGEGAAEFLAIDTDPDSIQIARKNAEQNYLSGIDFQTTALSADMPAFDLVCANLTLDVILPILPLLIAKARRTLVLSGILAEQESAVIEALSELGLTNPEITYSGEWIAVTIRKN